MTIAGLWSDWTDKATGEKLWFCTMVITAAIVGEVHDRMPVILEPDDFEPWLSCKAGMEFAEASGGQRVAAMARVKTGK